nr:hypothetical protein [Pseudomonas sp.]
RLPEPAQALMETHRLRLLARQVGVNKIDASERSAVLQFIPNPPIDPMRIIELVQKNRQIKLAGQDRLRMEISGAQLDSRVKAVRSVLRSLAG